MAEGVPAPLRGNFMIHVRIAYTGTAADGERVIRPLRAWGRSWIPLRTCPPRASATSTVTPLTLYLSATAGRWDTGSALPNFLGCETKPHQVRAAYRAADYEKLTAIKAPYDPRNPRATCFGSTTTSRRPWLMRCIL